MHPPRARSRRSSGFAMATTLYVVFTVLVFGLTLATMASFQYQFAHDAVNRGRALEAAQSGMSQAIYNLSSQSSWGAAKESITGSVSSDGSSYAVTFDATSGSPYSVNNLSGTTSVAGWRGQPVPPYSALLVSQGSIPNPAGGSNTRVVESVVQFAAFPYALAASNTVSISNALNVLGADDLASALAGGSTDTAGNVYAGSTSPTAVKAGAASTVSGRIRTPGGVSLGAGSTVTDGIQTGVAPEAMPDIDIDSYNNQGFQNVTVLAPGGTYTVITGPTYVNGDVTLAGAVLTNAYLYVEGDLKSILGLTGTGTIFVKGKTSIEGVLSLVVNVNSSIAIFSQEDLTMSGGNLFQGVLYTHGNLKAKSSMTVIGSVIAQSDEHGKGTIDLDRGMRIVYLSEFTQFGSYWTSQSMQGSLLNGDEPLLETLFWREVVQ